jgi:LSD1 subclass zinc finger protein
MPGDQFAVCATCRKPIPLGARLVRCSVTACNAGRLKLAFCSPACWDAHLPTARHRKASYVEEVAGSATK